jgi:GDP-4-dehydro-6-deoxy-D-mannose reductase
MVDELKAAGHVLADSPGNRTEITDPVAVTRLVETTKPDGVIHLAGIAFGPDAARDPEAATRVNAGGTSVLLRALVGLERPAAVVVAGSSEVYGAPAAADLPLSERAPTHPTSAYGRSKLAQEEAALDTVRDGAVRIAVTRSFNHTGPGQRPVFVAPAMVSRVLAARAADPAEVRVGNLDVRRDIGDVRDVVRAYRLILEGLAAGTIAPGSVLNVATGRAVLIRDLLSMIGAIVGVDVRPVPDPSLVRPDDPPEIVGDASLLRGLTGWQPAIPLERTLTDLVASIERRG